MSNKYIIRKELKHSKTYPWIVYYKCRELSPIEVCQWQTEQEAKDYADQCNKGEHGLRLLLNWRDPDTNRRVGQEVIPSEPEKVEELIGIFPLFNATAVNATLRKRLQELVQHKISLNKYNYYIEVASL